MMTEHSNISDTRLRAAIHNGHIRFGGNRKLKIYGELHCGSGKRMKRKNRVFFSSEEEAKNNGYRPCGHCMPRVYSIWKSGVLQERQVAE